MCEPGMAFWAWAQLGGDTRLWGVEELLGVGTDSDFCSPCLWPQAGFWSSLSCVLSYRRILAEEMKFRSV